jgi:hypothetical protein
MSETKTPDIVSASVLPDPDMIDLVNATVDLRGLLCFEKYDVEPTSSVNWFGSIWPGWRYREIDAGETSLILFYDIDSPMGKRWKGGKYSIQYHGSIARDACYDKLTSYYSRQEGGVI